METKNDYFTKILETCDGNLDFLIELSSDLLNMFSSQTYEILGKYIQEEDGENIVKTAHKLRGAVVNFNMEKTALLLQQLELMGKHNDLNGSAEILVKIRTEISLFSEALEVYESGIRNE